MGAVNRDGRHDVSHITYSMVMETRVQKWTVDGAIPGTGSYWANVASQAVGKASLGLPQLLKPLMGPSLVKWRFKISGTKTFVVK